VIRRLSHPKGSTYIQIGALETIQFKDHKTQPGKRNPDETQRYVAKDYLFAFRERTSIPIGPKKTPTFLNITFYSNNYSRCPKQHTTISLKTSNKPFALLWSQSTWIATFFNLNKSDQVPMSKFKPCHFIHIEITPKL
jgi:hypothetical protein